HQRGGGGAYGGGGHDGLWEGAAENNHASNHLDCGAGLCLHRGSATSRGSMVSPLHAGFVSHGSEFQLVQVAWFSHSFRSFSRFTDLWIYFGYRVQGTPRTGCGSSLFS